MSIIIDGCKLAADLKLKLASLMEMLEQETEVRPGLAVIRIGDNPASKVYVQMKGRAAKELNYIFEEYVFPDTISQKFVEEKILNLNQDSRTHGIILQLPLPKYLNANQLLTLIDPLKDVDGLNPFNSGNLFQGFPTSFISCAPLACLSLIQSVEKNLEGLNVGILGCSFLVGRPMAMLMLNEECTVCMGHIKTKNIPEFCKASDILIVAIGSPNYIQGSWIKKDAIVIDVGVNKLPSGKLVGDVDFESARKIAKAITPVPGGVGPMTVATLLCNTLRAAYNSAEKQFPIEGDFMINNKVSQTLQTETGPFKTSRV